MNSHLSFSEIVNQLQGMVYNTALGIVQNEQDAEDITQDVFIQVYESLNEFKADAKLSTWVYRITVNKALDFERKKKSSKRGGFLKRIFNTTEADEPVSFQHPGVALDKKEDAAALFKAISKLPDNQRVAFLLLKTEGLSYAEVADVMQTSVQAVESLQARAKLNLKKYLEDYYQKNFR
ncbi:MAG: RNA polymerase sigma factor [Ferruginibacter sp.]